MDRAIKNVLVKSRKINRLTVVGGGRRVGGVCRARDVGLYFTAVAAGWLAVVM